MEVFFLIFFLKEFVNNFFCYDFFIVNFDWKDIEFLYFFILYFFCDNEEIIWKWVCRFRFFKEVKGNFEFSEWDIIIRFGGFYVGKDKGIVEDFDEEM